MPPSRADLATEWRRSFVRASTAKVLAQIEKLLTLTRSCAQIGRLTNAPDDFRGAVEPLKQAGMPGNVVTQLISLAPESAAARLFQSAVQVDLSGTSQFSFPFASSFEPRLYRRGSHPGRPRRVRRDAARPDQESRVDRRPDGRT